MRNFLKFKSNNQNYKTWHQMSRRGEKKKKKNSKYATPMLCLMPQMKADPLCTANYIRGVAE